MAQDPTSIYKGSMGDKEFTINLPMWAKETTQTVIRDKLKSIDQKLNPGAGLGAMLQAALAKNTKAIQDLKGQQKKDNKGDDKASNETKQHQGKTQKAADDLFDATMSNAQALKDLGNLAKQGKAADSGSGGSLGDLATSRSPLGIFANGLLAAGKGIYKFIKTISAIATTVVLAVGREVSKVFNMLNDSLTDGTAGLIGAYQKSAVNISEMASKSGLSLSAFLEALAESSEEIAVLGAEGYMRLRTASIDTADGLFELGYKNDEVTKLLGREISIRARMGMQLEHGGRELAGDVVAVARELRRVGAVAGISAEALYEASKLDDETNSLIAARARDLGNDGISALQTSIKKLTIRMAGLSPTYANAITNPLVNAIITGAVGLDEGFESLVTVFPSLTKSMYMAQRDIQNSGEITDDTITDIMDNLRDASESEFMRAKQMALMTRNQTAILAVNFASEVRARENIYDRLNDQGQTLRDSAKISGQASMFFDMMKAPFENAISTFMISFLGVDKSGADLNLGAVVVRFAKIAGEFLESLPIIGSILRKNGFLHEMVKQIESYFGKDSSPAQKQAARDALNSMTVDLIKDIGSSLGDMLISGSIASEFSKFFSDLMDDIRISIFESTGLGEKGAAMAYLRRGQTNKVAAMQEKGMLSEFFTGPGSLQQLADDFLTDNLQEAAQQFKMSPEDFASLGNAGPGSSNPLPGTQVPKDKKRFDELMERYGMNQLDLQNAVLASIEYNTEKLNVFRAAGYTDDDLTKQSMRFSAMRGISFSGLNTSDLMEQFVANDPKAMQLFSAIAQNYGFADTMGSYSQGGFSKEEIGGSTYKDLNTMLSQFKRQGVSMTEQLKFKNIVMDATRDGRIDPSDGINDKELQILRHSFEEFLKANREGNADTTKNINEVVLMMRNLLINTDNDNNANAN